jgi:hypothetical protein
MAESIKKICKKCSKEFLIIQQENSFYEKKKLPMPENCPECRRNRRSDLRNKRELFDRACDKCGKALISTYKKDSPYIVYCEECYVQALG